jgi:hypothetical protein
MMEQMQLKLQQREMDVLKIELLSYGQIREQPSLEERAADNFPS